MAEKNPALGAADVVVTLGAPDDTEDYTLKVRPLVIKTLCATHGGLRPCIEKIQALDMNLMLQVVMLGTDAKGRMARELEEWIDMFLEPCYAALFGLNIGLSPDVDVSYFMAYPWHHHSECMHLSCMTNNMRWNRATGGCVPSVIAGADAQAYTGGDAQCSKVMDKYERVACKQTTSDLSAQLTKFKNCWSSNSIGNVDHMINYFCLPVLTTTKSTTANLLANMDACV